MTRFESAVEVKAFLKEKAFTEKVKVKRWESMFHPFKLYFSVSLPEREGVPTVSVGKHFGSVVKDPTSTSMEKNPASVEKARVLQQLNDLLEGTNASAAQTCK